ncbi:hypothetical protein [Actinomadura rugatobispora]|uniref:Uncharacterized protein n=1 Tax=Actinomadura rugatobispora TaxID=1994 RepID=A0ABW1A6Z6_9ACTN|nr:hypothetical protein GCM10010200_048030 [Actinomadura rugatobispora]
MGASGFSLDVNGDGDRVRLGSIIWETVCDFIWGDLGEPLYTRMAEYLFEQVTCTADDTSLTWWFGNPGGCCSRSERAGMHWLRYFLAVDWEIFTAMGDHRGLTFASGPPELAATTAEGRLVTLRGDIWSASDDGVGGDDAWIPLEELTVDERAFVAKARGECQCPVCTSPANTPRS